MEILVILVVTLLVFGPQQLPKMARTLGRTMAELRQAATGLRDAFNEEIRKVEDVTDAKTLREDAKALNDGVKALNQTAKTAREALREPILVVQSMNKVPREKPTAGATAEATAEATQPADLPRDSSSVAAADSAPERPLESPATAAAEPQKTPPAEPVS